MAKVLGGSSPSGRTIKSLKFCKISAVLRLSYFLAFEASYAQVCRSTLKYAVAVYSLCTLFSRVVGRRPAFAFNVGNT